MLPLSWKIIFLLSIQRSLCALNQSVQQCARESESSWLDIAQRKINSEYVILDNKTSKEDSSVYNREDSRFNGQKGDNKSYVDQDTVSKDDSKGRHSLLRAFEVVDQRKNSSEQQSNGYCKKGRRRTGSSNSYYKDQSGNNSSFYDDSEDEGGHRSLENNGGYYGQKLQDSFRGDVKVASSAKRDKAQKETYDNKENYDNYRGNIGIHENNRYCNDRGNYLQDEGESYYDRKEQGIYYYAGKFYPVIRRKIVMTSFDYYDVETSRRVYREEDLYINHYSRDYGYFPTRQSRYESEIYYLNEGYYDRNFLDDTYENEYIISKYRNHFDGYY